MIFINNNSLSLFTIVIGETGNGLVNELHYVISC